LQIDQELTKLWPWLGWHPFLTHSVVLVMCTGTFWFQKTLFKHSIFDTTCSFKFAVFANL